MRQYQTGAFDSVSIKESEQRLIRAFKQEENLKKTLERLSICAINVNENDYYYE